MSLFDYLNSDSTGLTGTTASANTLAQQIAQTTGNASLAALVGESSTSSGSLPQVVISLAAQQAAANAADADTDAQDLSDALRASFDAQAKAGKTPDMGKLSGRGLAIVALNQDGSFSRAEADAAKAQLRARDRQSALALLSSGDLTAASLKAYTQQLAAARNAMSAEERQLRDVDPSLR